MESFKFTPEMFDRLRSTLAEHLREELLPEREYKDKILALISDVKQAAADAANKSLRAHVKTLERVYQVAELHGWNNNLTLEWQLGVKDPIRLRTALLLNVEKIYNDEE